MTSTLYLLTLVLPLATVLIVFRMRTHASVQQARARLANGRCLSPTRGKRLGGSVADRGQPAALEANLSDVRTRMTAVETILKAVE